MRAFKAKERAAECATSTNKELTKFDKDMEEIQTKADQISIDPETRAAAKCHEDAIIQDGRQIQENAMIGMSEGDSSSQEKSRKKRKCIVHKLVELREQRERLDTRREKKEKEFKEMEEEVRVNSQKMLKQSERNTIAVERLAKELAEERR